MAKTRLSAKELTDAEVLEEFVRRFQCDGAVLVYLDDSTEYGFGRWHNARGRNWVNNIFRRIKQTVNLPTEDYATVGGTSECFL